MFGIRLKMMATKRGIKSMENYIVPIVVGVVIVLVLWFLITRRNRFVKLRNRVRDQMAQIDVQLKRRYDLIPNILESAKGYASFEKSTLMEVVNARNSAMNATGLTDELKANEQLNGALHRLVAVSESYPELKTNEHFRHLQEELSATEDKIAKSRQFYNDTVLKYNDAIEMFPANLTAKLFGFHRIDFLGAAEEERKSMRFSADDFK